jgi:cysteine-rich repeat protein
MDCCLRAVMHARRAVLAFAVCCATAPVARAERLLSADPAGRTAVAKSGLGAVERLRVDGAALARLRKRTTAVLDEVPLGRTRRATLDVRRIEPLASDARLVVMTDAGPRAATPPDETYFAGSVRGEPGSYALVVAGPGRVHGFVIAGGDLHAFGPDQAGRHRSWTLSQLDATTFKAPGEFCHLDLHQEAMSAPSALAALRQQLGAPPPPVAKVGALRRVQVALETDREFFQKFGDEQLAMDYLASLTAAANVIYERDAGLRLQLSYVRLWASGSDPWTSGDTAEALDELKEYWLDPKNAMGAVAGEHDLVHFLSGKSVTGGIAYLNAVCDPTYAFGVSQVFGGFDVMDPYDIWDVMVFVHELGHNFGSPHTHCYSPPIDKCFNAEPAPGCYSGPVQWTSKGTVMSYCHLNPSGGLSNIQLVFGDRPSARIKEFVAGQSCLDLVSQSCGNGTTDPDEDCDDGNTVSGDGCSDVCTLETTCGDGVTEGREQCDDGNVAAGDGCSPVCTEERCGSGYVDPGETCDDGNTASGDGCSAACATEACAVLIPHQTLWAPARLTIIHGARSDRIKLRARFAIPTPAVDLAVSTAGMRVQIADVAEAPAVELTIPGGDHWRGRGARFDYADASGTSGDGVQRVILRGSGGGGVTDVDLRLRGKGSFPLTMEDLPAVVTLVFGDDAAAAAGACGRYAFPVCIETKTGKKVVCR